MAAIGKLNAASVNALRSLEQANEDADAEARRILDGRRCRLLEGPYRGREAVVTQAFIDHGRAYVLVEIPRVDGNGTLYEATRKDNRVAYPIDDRRITFLT